VSRGTATDLVYLIAIVGFFLALKGLSSPKHARLGNIAGATGMVIAVAWTFSLPEVYSHTRNLVLIIVAIAIGTALAVPAARLVKMTAMPQMVAIFNGVGGGAAALVSLTEFISLPGKSLAIYKICEILFGVLVGSVSFAGSAVAFAKLQELMTGRPITYPGQQPINAAIGLAIVALLVVTVVTALAGAVVVVARLAIVFRAGAIVVATVTLGLIGLVVVVVADGEATRGQLLRAIERALFRQRQAGADLLGADVDGGRPNGRGGNVEGVGQLGDGRNGAILVVVQASGLEQLCGLVSNAHDSTKVHPSRRLRKHAVSVCRTESNCHCSLPPEVPHRGIDAGP